MQVDNRERFVIVRLSCFIFSLCAILNLFLSHLFKKEVIQFWFFRMICFVWCILFSINGVLLSMYYETMWNIIGYNWSTRNWIETWWLSFQNGQFFDVFVLHFFFFSRHQTFFLIYSVWVTSLCFVHANVKVALLTVVLFAS